MTGVRARRHDRHRLGRAAAGSVLVGALALTVAAAPAAADVVVPSPLGPITVPLPDPTTTTTLPPDTTTTTAPPDTTTTTAAPATTSTTRAPATTTTTRRARGTSTTTGRRATSTTAGAAATGRGGSGTAGGGAARPGVAPSARRTRGSTASSAEVAGATAARTPSVSGETIGPVTSGSSAPAGDDPLRSDFARAAAFAPGHSSDFDGSALAGLLLALVTAVVLGLAQRDASRQRRSQPSLVGAGALRLGRDEDEAGVREQLRAMLVHGPFTATGTDCRSLQLLVQAAAHEGLEVRDPRGFIVVASDRLVRAYGSEPDHKRLPLRWAVEVADASVAVPDGFNYVLERTGPDRRGRRLAFVPGTEMRLWTGDLI
jgi:hypothetical protein